MKISEIELYELTKDHANELTDRQKVLLSWLNRNHISGHFWSIEELCANVKDENGVRQYAYNTNPTIHDKCIALSSDIRKINWLIAEGCMVIVKNSKGGAKLCESEQEFESWREEETKPLMRKYQYLSTMKYKVKANGSVPIVDYDNKVNTEAKPIETLKQKTDEKPRAIRQGTLWEL